MRALQPLLADTVVCGQSVPDGLQVRGVVCDSRKVRRGDLFVAIPGTAADGMQYAAQAIERGAVAVVGEPAAALRGFPAWVAVPDARVALANLACAVHDHPSRALDVFGITGTNGKTTTAVVMREMLVRGGRNPGLLTTVEYQLGDRSIPADRTTPDAPTLQSMLAEMRDVGHDSAVMEVSSHALDQRRVDGMRFAGAAFTNLSRDHLDYHKTFEAYFAAKRRLFEFLVAEGAGVAVVNVDDAWGRKLQAWLTECARPVITYGTSAAADVASSELELSSRGTRFSLHTPWGTRVVRSHLLGRCNVANLMCAAALCGGAGIDLDPLVEAMESCRPMWGRLERVPVPGGADVFVDYAHTDDALSNVLTTLRELTVGRLIVVFGCGGDRDRGKRPAMGRIAAELADHCIVTSDNPRTEDPAAIIDSIVAGMPAGATRDVEQDRGRAIVAALAMGVPGDVVLIAGKGHESYQEIGRRTVAFDDREAIRRWAEGRR